MIKNKGSKVQSDKKQFFLTALWFIMLIFACQVYTYEEDPGYFDLNQNNGCVITGVCIRDGLCNVFRK